MKYRPINGYTKAKIIETIQTRMKDSPSIHEFGGCAYLAPDGNRCAVGAFLPDGHPAQKYNKWVSDMAEEYPELPQYHFPLPVSALTELQKIHDRDAGLFQGDNSDRRPALIKWVEENVEDSPEAQ